MTLKQNRKDSLLAVGAAGAVIVGLLGFSTLGPSSSEQSSSSPVTTNIVDPTTAINDSAMPNSTLSSSSPVKIEGVNWSSVAKSVMGSVVSVRVSSNSGGMSGVGSGVILDNEGRIITNNHVVAPAAQGGLVQVVYSDSSVYKASIVKTDPLSDLAVIKVEDGPKNVQAMKFSKEKTVSVGDPVMAVGSPLGLSGTVTTGVVSAVNRPVISKDSMQAASNKGEASVIAAVQTSAAINPGNSGGALVNSSGELVGITSSIATTGNSNGNIGIGFAIPSGTVRKISEQLAKGEAFSYGKLGVSVDEGLGRLDGHAVLGARIGSIVDGGGAAKAGLRAGDVVTGVNGDQVTSSEGLVAVVRKGAKGEEVSVTYARNGVEKTVKVVLS